MHISIPNEVNIAEALKIYSVLTENWDDDCAQVPTKDSLNNAEKFLHLIVSEKCIFPTSVFLSKEGEITFTWDVKDEKTYIDIGFLNEGYSYYSIDREGKERMCDGNFYNKDDLICLLIVLKENKHMTI